MSEIWLVRHGPTEWSETGRHTGRTDLPLLAEGRERSEMLAERLAGEAFDLVLTSPLRRATETAALAGFPDAEIDKDLVEWDYGDYEGITTPEIRETVPGWSVWTHDCPGGETADEVHARVDRIVSRAKRLGGRTLVFGHGHALSALTACWLGLDIAAGRFFRAGTATISVLSYHRETPIVLRWNA